MTEPAGQVFGGDGGQGAVVQHNDRGALDFFSPSFDAVAALSTPGLQPPDPDAQPLDYVAKCRVLLPPELPDSLAGSVRGPGTKTGGEATRIKHEQLKEKAARVVQRIQANAGVTLQGIMALVPESSPLSALRKWQAAGCAVTVVTRHASGVRGRATGQLTAFDMYMNLVLRDVVEHYTALVKVKRPVGGGRGAKPQQPDGGAHTDPKSGTDGCGPQWRWARKQEHRQRTLAQVLVKGDSIVCVHAATQLRVHPAVTPAAVLRTV